MSYFLLCSHISVDLSHQLVWNFPRIFSRWCVFLMLVCVAGGWDTSCGVQRGLGMSFLPGRMDYKPRHASLAQ